jgi:hypothetical protein
MATGALRTVAALALLSACSGSGPSSSGPCSAAAPTAADPCPRADLVCEYGDDPRPTCRVRGQCVRTSVAADGGAWRVESRDCAALPEVTCPASADQAKDQACTTKDAWCTYSGGRRCHCTDCRPGPVGDFCSGSPTWHCEPVPDRGCPASVPNQGTTCTGSMVCQYGCEWGARGCSGGIWVVANPLCPMAAVPFKSTR